MKKEIIVVKNNHKYFKKKKRYKENKHDEVKCINNKILIN